MNVLETVALGMMQGLTEFLPVSSSGHLVILKNLLGFSEPELLLDTVLHMATLVAVCVFFRRDIFEIFSELRHWFVESRRPADLMKTAHGSLAVWVIIGTLPTAAIGLGFRRHFEDMFGSPSAVGLMLLVTGCIVGITRLIPDKYNTKSRLGLWVALSVGLAQGLAVTPGISRSGITIVCALLFGLRRDLAGRFSFLLSIPAILGAVVLQLDSAAAARIGLTPLAVGFVVSLLVGLGALRVLMGMLAKGRLFYFTPYCWFAGVIVLLFH
ncbi:MAG: undecaprenyl-diphosphate phosphatase [Desulfatiglandaceae bacterium]